MSIASLRNNGDFKVRCSTSDSAIATSLAQLPQTLRQLNQTYIDHVARRSLISVADACDCVDSDVTVFLRHDKVCVFAIVLGDVVAMADFVTLADVTFHVDAVGRTQSNAEIGPLPNRRTVHAFLTGRLLEISNKGKRPDPEKWTPVVYHPLKYSSFVISESEQPVQSSREVRMVPGVAKVWVPKQSESSL